MRKRILFFLAIFISVGLLGLFVFQKRSGSAHAEDSSPVLAAASVIPVTKGSISSVLRVAGQFIPYQEVDLHAKVSGYIRTIKVDIGDRVRIGQVIAKLEVPELNAQL